MSSAFDPDECELLSRALEQAWTALRASGFAGDAMTAKAALSQGLLEAADLGERRLPELVGRSLAYFARTKDEEPAA
jgi:hypothetical protein